MSKMLPLRPRLNHLQNPYRLVVGLRFCTGKLLHAITRLHRHLYHPITRRRLHTQRIGIDLQFLDDSGDRPIVVAVGAAPVGKPQLPRNQILDRYPPGRPYF